MTARMRDRMGRRMRTDGRNPYGSRGGYVSSHRERRMRDRGYSPEYDSRYNDREHRRMDYRMDGNYPIYSEQYDYNNRPIEFYGVGGMYRPDYGYDMEKEWEEDLHEWIEHLKKYDKYGLSKEQIIQQAKNMGVRFTDYDELEFYTAYLMQLSDYPAVGGDYPIFIQMAKSFLEDEDAKLKGSDKLCEYYYRIVLGE